LQLQLVIIAEHDFDGHKAAAAPRYDMNLSKTFKFWMSPLGLLLSFMRQHWTEAVATAVLDGCPPYGKLMVGERSHGIRNSLLMPKYFAPARSRISERCQVSQMRI
jgi:hypothetical protein